MIEYAVLLHLKRSYEHQIRQQSGETNGISYSSPSKRLLNMHDDQNNKLTEDPNLEVTFARIKNDSILNQKTEFLNTANRIDNIALIVFNLAFCLFNCLYWICYLLF